MAGVYLSLGSNLGNRGANIALALRMLPPLCRVEAVSPLYETTPVGVEGEQPPYYNAACRIVTGLGPELLLQYTKRIEHQIGRRPAERNAPRPIDIDLILYNDLVQEGTALTLPHASLMERAFVLQPLIDMTPDLVDPRSGERLDAALARIEGQGIRQIASGDWYTGKVLV
jgi:2-amino-4-hydroxy-6-hydroxymethyldihydropteridine diphosphokinase